MKSRLAEAVLVVAVLGMLGWFLHPRPPGPAPAATPTPEAAATPRPEVASPSPVDPRQLSVCGVVPGMARARTLQLLGKPGVEGDILPAQKAWSYANYGSFPEHFTELSFTREGRVLEVTGDHVCRGATICLRLGDPESAIRPALGRPALQKHQRYLYERPEGHLCLGLDQGRVDHLAMFSGAECSQYSDFSLPWKGR